MRFSLLFMVLFCISGLTYDVHAGQSFNTDINTIAGGETPVFRRTYMQSPPANFGHSTVINRRAKPQRSTGVEITYDDLFNHLSPDNVRHTVVAEPISGQTITMDVGQIDPDGETPQNWIMPDLMQYTMTSESVEQIDWASTGFSSGFPDHTHAFYTPSTQFYEFYEINQDELFFYGLGKLDDADEMVFYDWYLTQAPLPLVWGLDFEGTVVFIYDEDPDYDSLVLVQHYEAVADGSLLTYDEGPVAAVKLHFTETITGYKDGAEVDVEEYREVVWYSVEGHYFRGLLAEGASFTGVTAFEDMRYQKISKSVSTDNTHVENMGLEFFPNPVSAGDVLTISNEKEIHVGLIQLYDMQGRLVQQIDLSGLGNVRNFQVQLPSDLVAGMYTYRATDPSGAQIGQGKLNIR